MRSGGDDPHRVLGVARGAPEAEIKRAYRALAKRHHPDGGQGSVARFLEIQAAYEALVGGEGPGAPVGQGGRDGTTPRSSAAWTRRSRPTGTRSSNPGTATGSDPNAGPRPAADPTRSRRASGRRRASLGSTTYDDAEEVFEPGWGGASWYGPSSGTYWTLNPREYADPRKHGPDYQARARRPVVAEPATRPAGAEPPEPGDAATEPATRPAGAERPGATEPPEPGDAATEPATRPAGAEPSTRGRPSVAARILRAWRRGTIHP